MFCFLIQVPVGAEKQNQPQTPWAAATWWLEPARHVPFSHWVNLEFLPPPNLTPALLKWLAFMW